MLLECAPSPARLPPPSASGEFGHTLLWGGFESLTDSHGATVSDYTVTSDSGTDWSKPVSEPEQPAETLSAAAVIAALARRRASRALDAR